jgi:hypothetical protein
MSNLATGATELMLAMQTPTPKGYWGVPVLVWGTPGTGKSTFIESLQRDGFPVYTMIASLHDPTDFNGLPVLHDGRMRFAPPEWVYLFEEHGQGILFLDELTTAPPTVQSENIRKRGHNCNRLLQVPPAGRGNRAGARHGSPREAGGEPAGAGKGTAIRFRNTVLQGNFSPTRGMESPLTPALSPLIKGGEGREWGDSACENPPSRAPNECGWCTLVRPIAEPEFKKTAVDDPLLKVPPARRGNRVGAPFAVPLAKRGEPKGGGQLMNFGRAIGIRPAGGGR